MRLYRVIAEIETYLVSEEEPDTYAAQDAAENEVRDNGLYDSVVSWVEIADITQIPGEILDTVPCGDAADIMTIGEWAERISDERRQHAEAPGQMHLFEAAEAAGGTEP